MRVLPNVLDFGLAYALFTPITDVRKFVRLWNPRNRADLPDSLVLFLIIGGFLLYTSLKIGFALWGYNLWKNAILSDSKTAVRLVAIVSAAGTVLFVLIPSFGNVDDGLSMLFLSLLSLLSLYPVLAAVQYAAGLKRLGEHPIFRYLVGLRRHSFAYATSRYRFSLSESLRVYWDMGRSYWRVYVIYLIMVLVIGGLNAAGPVLDARFGEQLQGWRLAAVVIGVFLIWSQLVAYGRKAVSNEATRAMADTRRRVARTASAVALMDDRAPILFLRSFRDDQIMVPNARTWGDKFLGVQNQLVRLEEVIAETMYAFGPVVALSNPMDGLPPLGAARENVADGSWQLAVERYMTKASIIVFVLARSEGFRWEVDRAIDEGHLGKCIFVFPPPYRTLEDRSLLISRIHPGLTLRLGLKEEEREIEELRDGVAFMELDPGGGFLLIRAPGEVESMGYAEALRLCATVMGSNKARQTVAQSVAAA